MKTIRETIQYILLLIPPALKTAMQDRRAFYSLSVFMFLQNIIMFMSWVVYFSNFSSLKGWGLADVAVMYGMAAFSFGIAFLFSGGTLDMARMIGEGQLDIYLGRPRHPLPGLMFREGRAAGFGDMITAPLLWVVFAHCDVWQLLLLTLCGLCSGLVILATTLVINCLPLFFSQAGRLNDQLLETFTIVSTYPQNGFPGMVKILLLTLVPAGFVAFVPVEAFKTGNVWLFLGLAAASVMYMTIAVMIFNRGLWRYASGNRMLEMR